MGRIIIILGSLLVPFIVYGLWLALTRRKLKLMAEGRLPAWQALPWTWLIVSGVLLMATVLITLRLLDIDPDSWIGGESLVPRPYST